MIASDPAGAVETRLAPDADARVEQAEPDANFGSSSRLIADLSPASESYLRFTVPAGTGVITKATLRLRVENATSNGPELRAATGSWDESTITWNNRPAPQALLSDAGKLSAGSWATYDVTPGVVGPGPVAFHLRADSSDSAVFSSSESGSNPPELVVESVSPDGTTDTTFPASIDAHAEESAPDRNFGSAKLLKVQGGSDPGMVGYLRFAVGTLPSGIVRKATLRLFVTNDTDDGPAVLPTSGDWSEGSLTWRNRPGPTGSALADLGSVTNGWVDVDVTGLVNGTGTFNLMLQTGSDDTLAFRSSEASSSQRPRLVVQTGPTTTTTSITTTTTTTPTTTSSTTTTVPPTTTTTAPTTTTTTAPPPDDTVPEPGEPWLGLARVVTDTCEPTCVRSSYSLSVDDVAATDTGDRRSAFRYPAGQSAALRLEWARSASGGGCGSPGVVTMDVSMRRPNGGARIGNAVWNAQVPSTCSGVLLFTVHFDGDPMDGDAAEAPYYGVMEVYGRLSTAGDATGADTRGAGPADPGDVPGRYARGHLVSGGFMVGWHEGSDDPVRLAANEATLGEPFGLVRSYSPTWKAPNTRVRDWLAQGKFVLWSVKPPADGAGNDDWTPVADGSQDDMIRQQVALLQSWAATGRTEVGYIFNHEPHDDADIPGQVDDCEQFGDSDYPCAGTPAEFIDIYERARAIIDELGADRVKLVYTATLSRASATAPGSGVLGSGDPMTRGEGGESVIGYVDLIAHDSYNWYCFWSACNWEFPDESGGWGRGVLLAETQGKQLIMAETASHPGCSSATGNGCENASNLPSPTRDDWLRRIGTWLESDARARRWIVGFAYYHTLHAHDWRFVDQTGLAGSGRDGWSDVFVTDSPANDALGGPDYFAQYGFNNL
jgi:hypothetical protein